MGYIIYLIIAIPLTAVSFVVNRHGRNFFLFLGAVFLVLIVPFSYKVGTDWYLYENSYYGNGLRGVNPDFLYKATMSFFYGLGWDYDLFAVVNRLPYVLLVICLVRKYTSYGLLALVAIVSSSFIFLNDSLRQQIASVFCLLAILSVGRSGVGFLLLVALGSLFHASAVFVLPVWLLYRSNFWVVFSFVVASIFFILSYFGFGLVGLVRYFWLLLFGSDNIVAYKILVYSNVRPSDFGLAHVVRFIIFSVYLFIYFRLWFLSVRGLHRFSADSTARMFFVGAFFMFFYEMIFFDAETFWRRLKEFFVFFFVLFPIYVAENYFGKAARSLCFLIILLYVCYVSASFFSSNLFLENYLIYRNYIYSLIFHGWDDDAYMRAIEFWRSWSPAGK